ncbi:MAG: STAS domain-containing protein [Cyanobacteria bacterium SID2]|nr:STAS domain-containing protein [Cyanobacteria bacterium SID2]MBP0002815.1 STAS domain-containing protein [Cyanobacteria bacterium SBC]
MTIVLEPKSKLDLIGAAQLQQDIERYITSKKKVSSLWIVDLSRVKTIGYAGLKILLTLERLAQKRKCRLVLQNPSATVRSIFDAALLTDNFEFEGDELSEEEEASEPDLDRSDSEASFSSLSDTTPPTSQPFQNLVSTIKAKLTEEVVLR